MAVTKDMVDQLRHLIHPLAVRVANTVARGFVQLVDDGTKMQLLQLGVLDGETVEGGEGAEHFQPVGLASVPPAGSECVVVFPNGDRLHPLVVVTSHRASRPTGGDSGQVTLYSPLTAAKVIMMTNGDIEIQPAPGREVLIREAGGAAEEVATKRDLDILKAALGSAVIAVGASGAAAVATACDVAVAALVPQPSPPTWPIGTKALKATRR